MGSEVGEEAARIQFVCGSVGRSMTASNLFCFVRCVLVSRAAVLASTSELDVVP